MVVTERPSYVWAVNEQNFIYTRQRTNQSRETDRKRRPDLPVPPHEHGVGRALHRTPCADAQIVHGADHVVELHKVRAPDHPEYHCAPERADEALHCLFWRQLDERGTPECDAPNIREYIIADYQRRGHPEPYQTLEDVIYDEMTGFGVNKLHTQRREGTLTSRARPSTSSCVPSRITQIAASNIPSAATSQSPRTRSCIE